VLFIAQGFSPAPFDFVAPVFGPAQFPEIFEIKFQLQSKRRPRLAAFFHFGLCGFRCSNFYFLRFYFLISIFDCLFRFVVFDLLKAAAARGPRPVPAS